jgi:hypothetical protein
MDEFVTWQSALSVSGAAAMVYFVNEALRKALGAYWTDLYARLATLVLAIAVCEVTAVIGGTNSWAVYLLQFINGCVVSLAVKPMSSTSTS